MAFMRPHYTNEPFHIGENSRGETVMVPADVYGSLRRFMDECEIKPGDAQEIRERWFYRLSAPGYMDATDWTGPFPTLADARADCAHTWEVDPDTGDDDSED